MDARAPGSRRIGNGSGDLGRNGSSNPTSVPYTLRVGALAASPCGNTFTSSIACQLGFPSSVNASLVTDNETDYYVFYAPSGAELSVTATDTEGTGCSLSSYSGRCGDARAELYDAQGDDLYQGTGSSSPNTNITVPRSFAYTIPAAGTYYLLVSGDLGRDGSSNPTSVPYTLNVSSSPNVQWPAPAPAPVTPKPTPTPKPKPAPAPCVVPRFTTGATLHSVETRITAGHCRIGAIKRAYSTRVARGRVLALSPTPGRHLASHARVTITLSAGRRPRR